MTSKHYSTSSKRMPRRGSNRGRARSGASGQPGMACLTLLGLGATVLPEVLHLKRVDAAAHAALDYALADGLVKGSNPAGP